ncbi:MAG: beta-galactosidase GalA [Ferruginibacter sp.]
MRKNYLLLLLLVAFISGLAQTTSPREHLLMDFGWRFAFGHPYDTKKDFGNGTSYFSYITKTGYGDGASAAKFDDRTWRILDLPHDWAVEHTFDSIGSFSHGFKAIGRNFPDRSVAWYRKTFTIPAGDSGRHISIAFDGIFRNSIVWINGHFLGNEPSGYLGFEYDLTDYLNYGGENVIAVRTDVTLEEGWFYEGAGIYRHVWLNKTNPLHVATNGSFVTSKVEGNNATVTAKITLKNDDKLPATYTIQQSIIDKEEKVVQKSNSVTGTINALQEKEVSDNLIVPNPKLWDIENPYLYKLVTTISQNGKPVDTYSTNFGIRTIRFDANEGFFLNGKHVEIKGTNNHQDHAGVGTAMPDALQEFRIRSLKAMGSNAYRCSHNPPTPELLDACDRLGMLVIDENRLMGTTEQHLNDVKRMIDRDRNHPSVISWSIGNEEWAIENSITGARIATTMQAYVKTQDTTRPVTYAFSGGITQGISAIIELMGYNYVANKNTDEQHKKFPAQLSWGTEEGSTVATRGEYADDMEKHYRSAYDTPQHPKGYLSIEQGWKWYAERPYLAGMFIWTGFDYRGEPTPFGWPSVTSYFGMMDLCGFPKDDVYYLKSWWMDKPLLHILPHWNWRQEGQEIAVWAYSNCDEVELFLNKKSLGKKTMQRNGHLEWKVNYQPGTLEAIGYNKGKKTITDIVQTTADAVAVQLISNVQSIKADKEDIAVITVDTRDKNNLHVPTEDAEISFSIEGPAKIIGVGNGKPTSLEPDKYLPEIQVVTINDLKEKRVPSISTENEMADTYDNANWNTAFKDDRTPQFGDTVKALVYRGNFNMPALKGNEKLTFFYNSIGLEQTIYINGKAIATNLPQSANGNVFELTASQLRQGQNSIAIAATPLLKKQPWDVMNMNPGLFQIITPAATWRRKLFNGLAQVIVQSTGGEGSIIVTATCNGLKTGVLKLNAVKAEN